MAFDESSSAIVSAVRWLEATAVGSAATTIAVITVASVGLMMLSGRIELRRALYVVLGCFCLFGASSIAQGIMATVQGSATSLDSVAQASPAPYYPPAAPAAPKSPSQSAYDPYAGAGYFPRH